MWNSFVTVAAKLLTWAWFAGVVLMLLTIPACMIKIFSALWEDHDEEEVIYDKPQKRRSS
ncbi:MAG: hypothetical protein JOZ10_07625 [Acidobacteria bacterium]|nr:hypothetical protein [Acidobacteriota bacterium]MBV9145746.1 hypothetical protein [Acidobacteriota bacterium]MBV9437226.1 hypothetical protein [Acidobacteriota bacterium]